eukprot:PITA_20502
MEEEYNSLLENQAWDLVPLPSGRKLVRCKWVYRTKSDADGKITKRKARLVAKGFQHVHGIDYDETFAPVAKMDSIRLTLAIVAAQGWEVHQMDVKNAFLHGDLSQEIYMEQPHGFIQDSSLIYRLKKSLYGLKQAPRAWYANMDSFLLSQNFERCKSDPNVYMLRTHDSLLILVLYVDDLLITDSSASTIAIVKRALHDMFLMMDMGPLHFFFCLEIGQDATTSNSLKLSTALNLLSFIDSDWAGDSIDRKSISGYSLSLESGPICWSSKKQAAIALSSVKVEYRGVVNITIQALWLQHFLTELGVQVHQPIVIWCDNHSTLKFFRDPVQRQQTKHIEIHMHYIRDLVHDWIIDLQFCPSAEQTADIFTKTFTKQKFHFLRDHLGVKDTVA